ncbi:phage tail protein [Halomonas borealis]|uniref:phage tail protein n=1 Tax=Halomonas borealis TaxID=2508710 RepID=UPI0010A09CCA|nr:phage tail protein [Halomonas borealis]
MALEPIKIRVDRQAVREIYDDLAHIKDGAPKAMSRAINHTLGVTRTEASKEVRKQVKLKAGYVRDKLKVRRATTSKPQGAIQTPTRGTLLTRYPNRQYKKGGIGVQVKPTGGKQKMPGAFFIRFANGNQAVAIRTKRGPGLGRSEGLKVLYGPSVSQVFTDVKDDLQATSGNRLMQRLDYEAGRLMAKQ